MTPIDNGFDETFEQLSANINAWSGPLTTGIYQFTATATNAIGHTSSPVSTLVAVYDPTGGFVTGAGWINSPAGAYSSNGSVTGKASFAFVSKYQKGSLVPDGTTEFSFKAAGLSFSGTSYEWLVVNQNGSNAQFKGSGVLNGVGNFGFMIWATDGGTAQNTNPDTFRISIWDLDDNNTVVYDNGVTQAIGGGNIIVHKAN